MTIDSDLFEGDSSNSTESTPLLYPAMRPSFSYNDDPKNPNHLEYQISEEEFLIHKKKNIGASVTADKKGHNRYIGIILAVFASFLLSLTTLIAKLLIQYHPFNEAMWRFQGILIPSIPILLWVRCGKDRDVFEPLHPIWKPEKLRTFLVLFVSLVFVAYSQFFRTAVSFRNKGPVFLCLDIISSSNVSITPPKDSC
jgi:hypothetical protein